MSAAVRKTVERWIEARIAGGIESALASRDSAMTEQALKAFKVQWAALDEAAKLSRARANGSLGGY